MEVLRGCRHILNRRPKIALELHTKEVLKFGVTAQDVLNLLDTDGYEVSVVARPDWYSVRALREQDLATRDVLNLFLRPK
jgi:hypothetical protein